MKYIIMFFIICIVGGTIKAIKEKRDPHWQAMYKSKEVHCPKCGSTSISANKKGFEVGKAAAGGLLLGPIGLLGGCVGKNKVECTCLKCGHKFKAGRGI